MLNLEYLKNLNEKQKEAVLSLDGPLLIVAGAGSGKTKVLISRMAHIIEKKKAYPNQILAVTFTNKAAKEMQNRITKILKKGAVGLPWLGTFHSVCAKLLRKHAKAVNLNSNFTIIDQDDQVKLIKNISKAENIDTKKISPKSHFNKPNTIFMNVLFPAPLLPSKPNISPLFKLISIFLNITRLSKDLDILFAARIGLDLNFIILNFLMLFIELNLFLLSYH